MSPYPSGILSTYFAPDLASKQIGTIVKSLVILSPGRTVEKPLAAVIGFGSSSRSKSMESKWMASAFGGEEGYRRYVPVIEAALEMGDPSSLKVKDGRGGQEDVGVDEALW